MVAYELKYWDNVTSKTGEQVHDTTAIQGGALLRFTTLC
jgi:hypothetical protein